MALVQSTLALLLVATTAVKVEACVCYVGQEPDATTGKRYGWSLAEKKPCECTEFRLGGVNMKPQIKPYEVTIGDDSRISINKQGEIRPSLDCNDASSSSPCQNYTTAPETLLELREPLASSMRLEFIVQCTDLVRVTFYHYKTDDAAYFMDLGSSGFIIYEKPPYYDSWTKVQSKSGFSFLGNRVIITFNNDRIEAIIKGLEKSHVTYDITSPYQASSWFISLYSFDNAAEWSFYEPCIPLMK